MPETRQQRANPMGAGASLIPLCLLLNLFALTIWRAVKQTLMVSLKQDHHDTQRPAWWRRRNVRTLRCSYLAAITVYVSVTSWAQLLGAGAANQLGLTQAVGLLLAGMMVLAACFAAAVALIPALQEALEMYLPIFSTAIFALGVTHCTWCQLMGALRMGSFWEPALLYVLFWLLDDTPPDAYMPQLFTACAMQTTVVSGGAVSMMLVMRLKGVFASYVLLAWMSSKSLGPFSHKYLRPSELPSSLFRPMCAIATLTTALSLLLCSPPVVEPLLRNPQDLRAPWLAGLVAALVQAPAPGTRSRFGLSQDILASVAVALLCMLATSLLLFSVVDPPLKAHPPRLAVMMEQNPTTYGLLVYLRSLPPNKLCTVCLMLVVGQLQSAAMLYIGAQLLFVLPWSNAAPSASVPHVTLLLVMLGVVLQVLGLSHLTIDAVPDERGSTPRTSPLLLSPQLSGISGMAESHLASAFQNLSTPDEYNLSDDLPTLPSIQNMEVRIDALAKFKAFMQGLNQQADGYSIGDFIQGSKRVVHEVFPGVRLASFCLLDSKPASCNIYNIVSVEEGPQHPPIVQMDIATNTLIHHVLTTCQPVFIDSIAAVQDGPTDLKALRLVLGLGSVACLPLMASSHVLGVLRLGYDVDHKWEEQEQALAKQLALILSFSTMDDGPQESQGASAGGPSPADMQLLEADNASNLQCRGVEVERAASHGVGNLEEPSLLQQSAQDLKRNRAHSSHLNYSFPHSYTQYQDRDLQQWSHPSQQWFDQHLLPLREQQLQQQQFQQHQQQQQYQQHQQQQQQQLQSPQSHHQLWGQPHVPGAFESSAPFQMQRTSTFPAPRPRQPQDAGSPDSNYHGTSSSSSCAGNFGPRRTQSARDPLPPSKTFNFMHGLQQGTPNILSTRGRKRGGRTRLSQCTSSSSPMICKPAFLTEPPSPMSTTMFTAPRHSAPHLLTTYPFMDHRRHAISLATPSFSSNSSSHTPHSASLPVSRGTSMAHVSLDTTTQSSPERALSPKYTKIAQQDFDSAFPTPPQLPFPPPHAAEHRTSQEASNSTHQHQGPTSLPAQRPTSACTPPPLQVLHHLQRSSTQGMKIPFTNSQPLQRQPPQQQHTPPPGALTSFPHPPLGEQPHLQHSSAAPGPRPLQHIQHQEQQQYEQHQQQQQQQQQQRRQLFPAGGAPRTPEVCLPGIATHHPLQHQQLPHHPNDIATMDRAELQWQLLRVQQQLAELQQQHHQTRQHYDPQQQQQQQQQGPGWGQPGPNRMVSALGGPYAMMGGLSTVPPSPSHHSSHPPGAPHAAWPQGGSLPRGSDGNGGAEGGRDWQQMPVMMGMPSTSSQGGGGLAGLPPWAYSDFSGEMAMRTGNSTGSPNTDASHRLWHRMGTISTPLFSSSNSLMSSMHAGPPLELHHGHELPPAPSTPSMAAVHNFSILSNYSNFNNQLSGHMFGHAPGFPEQQWGGSMEGHWHNLCADPRPCEGTNAQQGLSRPSSEGLSSSNELALINANNPHTDVQLLGIIGRGGFGTVYKALWHDMLVAVKVLEHGDDFMGCTDDEKRRERDSCIDASGRRAALLEGAMTSTIKHPNVVQTFDYRVVHLNQEPPIQSGFLSPKRVVQETHIIMELCDMGTLQDAMKLNTFLLGDSVSATSERRNSRWQGHRRKAGEAKGAENKAQEQQQQQHRTASLSVAGPAGEEVAEEGEEAEEDDEDSPAVDLEALSMTLAEVAAAMAYLHAHRITHRDLKPKNILLRSSDKDRRGFVAKVSDFGLSQVLPEGTRTQVSQRYSGTVTHMPPELIEDGKVYQQGDVYAFGIMMWELYTNSTPYPNMAHPQIMVAVVMHNLRPKFPSSCPEWFRSLAYKCWRKDPKLRPSFAEITAHLTLMMQNSAWGAAGDSRDNMERNLTQSLESEGLLQQQGVEAEGRKAEEQY